MELIGQIVGFVGMAANVLSYQRNKQKEIVIVQVAGSILFLTHYILIGAYTGAALNFVGLLRNLMMTQRDKPWAQHKAWLVFWIVMFIGVSALTWEGIRSILPMLGMSFYTIALWNTNPKILRRISFCGAFSWMAYNIISRSYAGTLTEIFTAISLAIAMWRFDFRKTKKGGLKDGYF